ncbi:hypothetical protein AMECASPLE_032608 [Ameca splendens]|uniref:Uncharacterized protein n=1 Tax=Ameca splendens TaxID=208324 RepID=A0ABV0YHN5_9TELE
MGWRQGHQSIAGQHRHTQDKQPSTHSFTPKGNVEKPINLTVMILDCGRRPEYPERTHACTGKTCKLHAERPRTFLLQGNSATNCATMQPSIVYFRMIPHWFDSSSFAVEPTPVRMAALLSSANACMWECA